MTYLTNLHRLAAAALVGTVGCCLIGCASNPPADAQIALAKASIARAEQAGAPQAAPTELAAARDKLARAEKGNDDHHSEANTKEWAEQANVDAQVAEAMALQQRSHKAAMDFDASMQTLQQESMRSSQPQ
jgi:hypothetical protein